MSTSGGIGDYLPTIGGGNVLYMEALPGFGVASQAQPNETMVTFPFYLSGSATITKLGEYVSVAGSAGAQILMGIYNDTGHGVPNSLVVDGGSIDATVTGLLWGNLAQPVTLTRGWYWTASLLIGSPATLPDCESYIYKGYPLPLPPGFLPIPTAETSSVGTTEPWAYGGLTALPAVTPTPPGSDFHNPRVLIGIAA